MSQKIKIISIFLKCSDAFSIDFLTQKKELVGAYQGYVPKFLAKDLMNDYLKLEIDISSGQILNWKQPIQQELTNLIESTKIKQQQKSQRKVMSPHEFTLAMIQRKKEQQSKDK